MHSLSHTTSTCLQTGQSRLHRVLIHQVFQTEQKCTPDYADPVFLWRIGPAHAIFLLIAYAQMLPSNAHADVPSWAKRLTFGMGRHLHSNVVNASSKVSGESAHMRYAQTRLNLRCSTIKYVPKSCAGLIIFSNDKTNIIFQLIHSGGIVVSI